MDWLPTLDDAGGAIRAARSSNSNRDRLNLLAHIARHRLSFVETIQLDRLIVQTTVPADSGILPAKLAIIGSTTLSHLAPAVRVAGLRHGFAIDLYVGGFGQFRQDALDSNSGMHRSKPQFVLFSMAMEHVVGRLPIDASSQEADSAIQRTVSEIAQLWASARSSPDMTIIQQTFIDVAPALFGSYERTVAASRMQLTLRLNEKIAEKAAGEGVLLLDLARRVQQDGLDTWFESARWFQAKQEVAPKSTPMYGELLARILSAQFGRSRKCLVLDLDNTLWGGVVGDDGIDGIVLGQGNPVGEAHLALQDYARSLRERGIILAVCSKNDPRIAEDVFLKHPDMLLKRTDIASFQANWNDKVENLTKIARDLNIGLDSLVFVDDNPAERMRVREALPMVAVPELPDDPVGYVRTLADAGYFEAVSFTGDDTARAGQYEANSARDVLQSESVSIDEFLISLNMSLTFSAFQPDDIARIVQLFGKTNQFNVTTKRYTREEVLAAATDKERITLQLRLADRFGDNGLISAMIMAPSHASPREYTIDNWVMSCRVFNRELEFETLNIALDLLRERGAKVLTARFVPTAKNAVICDLFERLGFRSCAGGDATDGSVWRLDIGAYVPKQTRIKRSSPND